jgi:hypothetical protein
MGKLKEALLKSREDIEQAKLPTPAEVSEKFEADAKAAKEAVKAKEEKAAKISPTIQMAIDQGIANKIKDEYHGFK